MSEATANAGTTPAGEGATEENPAMEGSQKTLTQDEANALIGNARKKERAKYANYEEYKAAFEELQQLKEKDKTEAQRALERAEAAEKELADIKAKEALAKAAAEIAERTGVPAEALRGGTPEEMEAHAEVLAPFFKKESAPKVNTGASSTESSGSGDPLRDAISNAL